MITYTMDSRVVRTTSLPTKSDEGGTTIFVKKKVKVFRYKPEVALGVPGG
jgi:hypothetical protein